jgi:hypothetical protein
MGQKVNILDFMGQGDMVNLKECTPSETICTNLFIIRIPVL